MQENMLLTMSACSICVRVMLCCRSPISNGYWGRSMIKKRNDALVVSLHYANLVRKVARVF